MEIYEKDPDAKLDYTVDWSQWMRSGDSIASSQWIVPDGITQDSPSPSFTATTATIWLSGGRSGSRYEVTNRITSAQGRIDDMTLVILVRPQ